jgi:anti-sigma B factor antagonist
MPMEVREMDGGVTRVALSGRIDIAGAHAIDMPLSVVAGSRRAVIIDLEKVDFIASMGLRSLVIAAKSINSKRGKCVLLKPNENVTSVLTTSGIDTLIPIYLDETEAIAAVKPA